MKFIHCSDIHLDSKMESNLSARQAQERNNEICATFGRMVAWGKEQGVDAVILAGDLFDTDRVQTKTVDYILSVIAGAQNMDFLYLRGNHDESHRAFSGRALPENLKFFSDSWTTYRYGNVTVTGAELTEENSSIYDSLRLSPDNINIVTLHGQIGTKRGADQVSLPDLRGKHIRYLALGHIHSYQRDRLDPEGEWCYCGCLEGRGFDECGSKGFVLLETRGNQLKSQFVPFASRTLWDIPVDISDCRTVNEICDAMKRQTRNVQPEDLVKFTLQGTYTPETQKDLNFLQQLLSPGCYFVKIKDESCLYMEKASYEKDISLKGEFIRLVMGAELSEEDRDKIICAGLQALGGEEITL